MVFPWWKSFDLAIYFFTHFCLHLYLLQGENNPVHLSLHSEETENTGACCTVTDHCDGQLEAIAAIG